MQSCEHLLFFNSRAVIGAGDGELFRWLLHWAVPGFLRGNAAMMSAPWWSLSDLSRKVELAPCGPPCPFTQLSYPTTSNSYPGSAKPIRCNQRTVNNPYLSLGARVAERLLRRWPRPIGLEVQLCPDRNSKCLRELWEAGGAGRSPDDHELWATPKTFLTLDLSDPIRLNVSVMKNS